MPQPSCWGRSLRSNMERTIGFFLSHEQLAPGALVELAVAAEQAGFDSVWTSDHFQPWQ
ncbi:MAG: LLM class flavin-dependent oxidoreductase, partial [Dehalococcoidia bacterium]